MASYRRNAESNRDALFGSTAPGGADRTKNSNRTRGTQHNVHQVISSSNTTTQESVNSSNSGTNKTTDIQSIGSRRVNTLITSLTGAAKVQKMKEAEEYCNKAKKAMTKGLFSPPDPIGGAMFYHRAAETYKLCGEDRLERLHRIASGDCQRGHGAFSSAAKEYERAAELSELSDEVDERKRAECMKLYSDAADAWKEAGDIGRCGECKLKSAFSLLIGNGNDEEGDNNIVIGGMRLMGMTKDAIAAIEAAVESHVPDPLNRYSSFRQEGISAFVDPDAGSEQDEETLLELCRSHLVTASYTNEILFQAVKKFVEYGEYKSALYATGAVTALLEHEGLTTISLSRSFCVETILALAIGDVVTADKYFVQAHLQNSNYLTSRECKLAEDLIRAVKMRDVDDLEDARNPSGSNKGALANLDTCIRGLVAQIRISGAVKKSTATSTSNKPLLDNNGPNLHNELDNLMNDMGLNDDEDDEEDIDLT